MSTRTVREELEKFAQGVGMPFEQYLELWALQMFPASLPERYKRIGLDVVLALPARWGDHAVWRVEANTQASPNGYAKVFADEAAGEIYLPYVITIYPSKMDRLSDSACRWVFARGFAHIASKLGMTSIVTDGKLSAPRQPDEDAADQIALEWSFGPEMQAFYREDGKSR